MSKDIKSPKYFDDNTVSIYEIIMILRKRMTIIGGVAALIFIVFGLAAVFTPKSYRVSGLVTKDSRLKMLETIEEGVKIDFPVEKVLVQMENFNKLSKEQRGEQLGAELSILKSIKDVKLSQAHGYLKIEVVTSDVSAGEKAVLAYSNYIKALPVIQSAIHAGIEYLSKNREDLRQIIENPHGSIPFDEKIIFSSVYSSLFSLFNITERMISYLKEGDVLTVETYVPKVPFKPNLKLLLSIGAFLGVFTGTLLGFFIEWLAYERLRYQSEEKTV